MPAFLCDAMLGGLAGWLRAAGYDTVWKNDIPDGVLLARALSEGRTILTSDSEFARRRAVRDRLVPCLFIPRDLPPVQALRHVIAALGLTLLPPRCMACGGELLVVDKSSVRDLVGAVAYSRHEDFWRCARCRKVYWRGTHWTRIKRALEEAAPPLPSPPP
ncbi:MAG: Mut7-C RNAse domain-containing protein [Planctomycetota bacterium]